MQQCIEPSRTNGRGLAPWCGELVICCAEGKTSLFGRSKKSANRPEKQSLGDWSDGDTPGHIPNPVVKAVSADGTWGAAPWESRSLPRDFSMPSCGAVFCATEKTVLTLDMRMVGC